LACSSSFGNFYVVKFLREVAREKGTAEAENCERFHCKVIAGTRKFESCLTQGASSESYSDRDFLAEDVVSAVNELDLGKPSKPSSPARGYYIHDDVKWDHHIAALPTDQANGSVTFTGVMIDLMTDPRNQAGIGDRPRLFSHSNSWQPWTSNVVTFLVLPIIPRKVRRKEEEEDCSDWLAQNKSNRLVRIFQITVR
jgi:hypothetical protein